MNPEKIFLIANTVALSLWIILILLPVKGREEFYKITKRFIFPVFALAYSSIIFAYFQISNGGFGTLQDVSLLFSNEWALLAGWIHYLIFDLFVGVYIARRLDDAGIPKLFQAFILFLTFMFGPIGLFVYYVFTKINTIVSSYIYRLYPPSFEVDTKNRVYTYTLFALSFTASLLPIVVAASFIDTRLIGDVNVWTKPLKFIVAAIIHFGTLLVLLPLIQGEYLKRKFLTIVTIVASYSLVLEIIYITAQALRGRDSHFNNLTQFESVMYGLMGFGAVLGVIGSFVIGYYIYRFHKKNVTPGLKIGVGGGIMLSSVLIFFVAGYLGSNGSHFIDESYKNISLLPILGWSTIYGDLRVSHFFALHTMQIVPMFGLLSLYKRKYEKTIVYLAALICVFVVAFTFWQAINDIPFVSI